MYRVTIVYRIWIQTGFKSGDGHYSHKTSTIQVGVEANTKKAAIKCAERWAQHALLRIQIEKVSAARERVAGRASVVWYGQGER